MQIGLFTLWGLLTGGLLALAFPPFELYGLSLLGLLSYLLLYRNSKHWGLKILMIVVSQLFFFSLFHEKSEWLLEIATRTNPQNFFYFEIASLIQYSLGSILIYSAGVFLPRKFIGLIFTAQFFVSTSNYADGILIPLLASPWIHAVAVPFSLFLFVVFLCLSSFFDLLISKKMKIALIPVVVLIAFIVGNNQSGIRPMPVDLVLVEAPSFNLDDKTYEQIESHFLQLKPSQAGALYFWPEALVTFKLMNASSQKMVEEVFQKHFPGIHYYGAYTIKGSDEGKSFNRYMKFETKAGKSEYFDKAFPVPYQEDSDYFWFIPQKKIELSFNVKRTEVFKTHTVPNHEVEFYLCNEIADLKHIMLQAKPKTDVILLPSNPPVQNVLYYEGMIDFYSRALSKMRRLSVAKISSHK